MKAYHSDSLFHASIKRKAGNWFARQLISDEQYSAILNHYSQYTYTPNVFVRIGLFIFTCFIAFASLGIYFLLFSSGFNFGNGFYTATSLLYAVGCFVSLELFIRHKKIYKSGTDDALLYLGLISVFCFIYSWMDAYESDDPLLLFSCLLPILFMATLRYADRLVALVMLFCAYAIVFLIVLKAGDIAKLIMPSVFMGVSAGIYFVCRKLKKQVSMSYWHSCLKVVEFVSLLIFYASGNYFIIRESAVEFFDMHLLAGEDIPLAFVFYTFTALTPLIYIYVSLKNKNRTLLWAGLVVLAAGAVTFKYYFSMGHPEITLTLAGTLLILVAYFSIQYFKQPRHGITFEEEPDADSLIKTNAEAVIIAEGLQQEIQPVQNGFEFGGGQSGGAGSGGSF